MNVTFQNIKISLTSMSCKITNFFANFFQPKKNSLNSLNFKNEKNSENSNSRSMLRTDLWLQPWPNAYVHVAEFPWWSAKQLNMF